MTVTASQILERLEVLMAELDEAIEESTRWARAYAGARPAYDRAKALAFVETKGQGTVAEREAFAEIGCSDESFSRWEAEVLWKNAANVMKARIAKITALQTWASNVKSERDMAARGPQVRP